MGELEDRYDFFIIQMYHYDMILGTKWVQKMGFFRNFEEQWVDFNQKGRKI